MVDNQEGVNLKEYFEKILDEREKAYDQRFMAQEKAIDTAEKNRDVAINKAETSIEKKSDAVYVKLTDLQKALTEVMLRPEIEARLQALSEKYDDLKTSRDTGQGKEGGRSQNWAMIATVVSIVGGLIAIGYAILK